MSRSTGGFPPMPADRGRQLAEAILAEVRRAGGRPGFRLPTERQLADDLGATRTTVRHALAVLEAEGYVSREVGRGTFLRDARWARAVAGHAAPTGPGGAAGPGTPPGPWQPAGGDHDHAPESTAGFAPADVMATRRLLEPPAMRLVVAWATAADFQEMERCLAGARHAASYDEFEVWDLALHRAIMAASHSPLLTRLYAVVSDARHGHLWGDLKRRSGSPDRQREYQADHEALVAALRARDPDGAVAAMRDHLSRINGYLFGESS